MPRATLDATCRDRERVAGRVMRADTSLSRLLAVLLQEIEKKSYGTPIRSHLRGAGIAGLRCRSLFGKCRRLPVIRRGPPPCAAGPASIRGSTIRTLHRLTSRTTQAFLRAGWSVLPLARKASRLPAAAAPEALRRAVARFALAQPVPSRKSRFARASTMQRTLAMRTKALWAESPRLSGKTQASGFLAQLVISSRQASPLGAERRRHPAPE